MKNIYRHPLVVVPVFFVLIYLLYSLNFFNGIDLCAFKLLTKIPCPGCGITRGIISIMHLDLKGAINYNPASFFIVFFAFFLFISSLIDKIFKTDLKLILRGKGGALLVLFLLAALLINWAKNLFYLIY